MTETPEDLPPWPRIDVESAELGELLETLDAYTKLINSPHVVADGAAVELLGAEMGRINTEIQTRRFGQELHDDLD